MKEIIEIIIDNVKTLGKINNVSMSALAKTIGYTQAGFHRALHNGTIKLDKLQLIADHFNVSLDALFTKQIQSTDVCCKCTNNNTIDPELHQMD